MSDKDNVAQHLAAIHYDIEPGIRKIFRLREKPEIEALNVTPIKLLEVNENTAPMGIMPLRFGALPERGIHYSSVIIEVTPAEYEKIRSGELPLPAGWVIEDELAREAA